MNFKSFIFISLIILNIPLLKEESDDKLLFVWEHFRHGARGPYKSFDYKNWKDILNEKWRGAEELTSLGMRMNYLLGVATRKRYKNFLSSEYNPNEIFIISSNTNRTLLSAYSTLQGIYNKSKNINLKENQIKRVFIQNKNYSKKLKDKIFNIKDKPIEGGMNFFPVHIYNHKELKFQLYRKEICPGIWPYIQRIRKSEGMQNIYKNINRATNENFGKFFFQIFGNSSSENSNFYNFEDIKTICDTFISDYVDGREIENFKKSGINLGKFYEYCLNISLVTSYYNYYGYPNEKTVELGVSPTFREIFYYMDKRILLDKCGEPEKIISSSPKFIIVSSHDISLAAIDLFLESKFGIKYKRADYASSQIFELWKKNKNGKYLIKYLINFEISGTFDYDDFKNKVFSELYSEEEIKEICFYNSLYNLNKKHFNYYYSFLLIIIFLIFLIISLIIIKKRGKKIQFKNQKLTIEMKEMPFSDEILFE